MGKLDPAIGDYDKALELDPDHSQAYTGRGLTRLRKQDWDPASADLEKASRLEPDSPDSFLGLARFHSLRADTQPDMRKDHIARALELLEKAAVLGYRSWDKIHGDPDFQSLREEPRFRMLGAEKPKSP